MTHRVLQGSVFSNGYEQFPISDNRRTGKRSESTRPTCNCQLFPKEASFSYFSGQWEPLIISVRFVVRNSGSAEITKITTPQREEHVKSNYQSLDSDSYPKNQFDWKKKKLEHLKLVSVLGEKKKKRKKYTLFQQHHGTSFYLIKRQIQKKRLNSPATRIWPTVKEIWVSVSNKTPTSDNA